MNLTFSVGMVTSVCVPMVNKFSGKRLLQSCVVQVCFGGECCSVSVGFIQCDSETVH